MQLAGVQPKEEIHLRGSGLGPAAETQVVRQHRYPMIGHDYFLVVHTEGLKEAPDMPPDMVLTARYWHPGDREWVDTAYASLDDAVADLLRDSDWKLVQRTDLPAPYEHELIFSCRRTDFDDVRSRGAA